MGKEVEPVEIRCVVANLHHDGWIREGAKCYIGHDTDGHPDVIKRSVQVLIKKNGRWARKWVRVQKLYNARMGRVFAPKGGALHCNLTNVVDAGGTPWPRAQELIDAINAERLNADDRTCEEA